MFKALLEIAGVVLFRFPPLVRMWAILVAVVNMLAVVFLNTVYGQVVTLALLAALVIMAWIYAHYGFTRLLGIGHLTWVVMLPWLYFQLDDLDRDSMLYYWIAALLVINSICLAVDTVDVARFGFGDRKPHYKWRDLA